MRRESSLLRVVAAIALLTVPLAGLAPAAAQSSDPAGDWTAVRDALDEGDVATASSTYEDRFQEPAAEAPEAKRSVEQALAAAQQAEPGSAEYTVAAQVVEKGLLAVSYEATLAAAAAGDAERARGFLDVLATKFDGGAVADAEAAFADASSGQELADAAATLNATYRSHIASEVLHEVEEVPELIEAGETGEAAKEAAEASGYALSIHAAVEASLGTQDADALRENLTALTEQALAGDADATRETGEAIRALIAEHGLATVPLEKVEAFHAYKTALGEDRFDDAESIYEDAFGEDAREYAPAAHERALEAIDAAETATAEDRTADRTVQDQIAKKAVLEISWTVGFHELREEEVREALEYLAVLADKFGWLDDAPAEAVPLGLLAATGETSTERLEAIRGALGDKHASKVGEEVEEVFINWDDRETAREKAIEGVLYARPAAPWFEAELGEAATDELLEELEALYNATTAGDREAADEAAGEVNTLLEKLAAGEGASELEKVLVSLEDKIDFVAEEYRGYHEAKDAGEESEAQTEIGEARAFTNRSIQVVDENADLLEEANASALDELRTHLDRVQAILADLGPLEELEAEVDAAVTTLEAFEGEPEGPAVDLEVGQPSAEGDAVLVPVRLVGVPEAGYSLQATITYDASALTVDSVEVPAAVGASTTSEGEVRFNAADTQVEGGTATVAELTVTPTGAGEATLDVTVETLTDDAGEEMRLGNVTGTTLDLAAQEAGDVEDGSEGASEGNGTGPAPAPAPGVLALVAVLGALAALTRRA